MAKLSFELQHKNQRQNSWLRAKGQYLPSDSPIRKAILSAGWIAPPFPPSPIPEEHLEDWMDTDAFVQPQGHGLFGGSTEAEWQANLKRLKAALTPLGIRLKPPRLLSMQELI